ncbi:hypothetical protein EVAR_9137_1 [Eumeta japonica]|uniref:Uncharacterized protein n=1 Tax=Eumeta variegata TaxID=151549 RepID=A0A4C1TW65_EUMVA|nr:hypothetical protein EVAR_9137_1 [Eumeta japonica]
MYNSDADQVITSRQKVMQLGCALLSDCAVVTVRCRPSTLYANCILMEFKTKMVSSCTKCSFDGKKNSGGLYVIEKMGPAAARASRGGDIAGPHSPQGELPTRGGGSSPALATTMFHSSGVPTEREI